MPQINVRQNLLYGKYKTDKTYPISGSSPDYKTRRQAYREDVSRLENQLKLDLFEEHGVSGLAADLVWAKAWEHGHSSGIESVIDYFEDFLDILIAARTQYTGSLT